MRADTGQQMSGMGWRLAVSIACAFAAVAALVALGRTRVTEVAGEGIALFAYAPPAGVAGAVLASARRRWVLGSVVVVLFALIFGLRMAVGESFAIATLFASVSVIEVVVFAWLARRVWPGIVALDSRGHVLEFLAAAALASVAGGVLLGLGTAPVSGLGTSSGVVGASGAAASFSGIVAIAPAIFLRWELLRLSRSRGFELAAFAVMLGVVTHLGFSRSTPIGAVALTFLPAAFLLFAVVRNGRPAATVLPIELAALSLWYMLGERWGFAELLPDPFQRLFAAQLFNVTMLTATWLVAALEIESEATAHRLARANRDLEARVAERTEALELLQEITEAVADAGGRDDLVDRLLPRVRDALRADAARLVLLDDTSEELLVAGQIGRAAMPVNGDRISVGEGFAGRCAALRAPLVMSDLTELRDPAVEPSRWIDEGAVSAAGVPLMVGGNVLGVLTVGSRTTRRFTDDDVALLQRIAEPVASAVERGRVSAALQESEEHFRDLFEHSPIASSRVDLDGRVVQANDALCVLLGLPADELIGELAEEGMHPDDRAAGWDYAGRDELLRGERTSIRFERRFLRAREHMFWAEVTVSVLRDARRQPQFFIAHMIDVTERRVAQDRLQRRARRSEVLARCSRVFQEVDEDYRDATDLAAREVARLFNGNCMVLLGTIENMHLVSVGAVDADEVERYHELAGNKSFLWSPQIGEAFETEEPVIIPFIDPAAAADLPADMPASVRERAVSLPITAMAFLPLRTRTRTMGVMVVIGGGGAGPLSDGDVSFLVDVADRIALAVDNVHLQHEREAAQSALSASEENFRSAFNDAPVGAAVVSLEPDRYGTFVSVNDAFCTMLQYSAEELVGRSTVDVTDPLDVELSDHAIGSAVEDDYHRVRFDKRYVRKDGEIVWARVTASIIEQDGQPHHGVSFIEDVTERRVAEAELARRALFDEVTGLANRARMFDRLHFALEQLHRRPGAMALLYLDLDRFKDINDSLGHAAGDEVLAEVGRRVEGVVRSIDTAARIAGDEFVVVCPELSGVDDAIAIAERLLHRFTEPMQVDGQALEVAASIGIACTTSARMDPNALLREADDALYHAKRRGRCRWEIYNEALEQRAHQRLGVEGMLRQALEDDCFRLHYQPVVDVRDERIVGVEALLRLQSEDGGLVMPSQFIDVAEDSQLIVPIGDWVLREACRQAAVWNDRFGPVEMAVNISGRQVIRLAVVDQVMDAATAASLDPAVLTLEFTERVLIESHEDLNRDLMDLRARGFRLSIDDFGTGYSSITYLSRFPVDVVKIDRSFVNALGHGDRDNAIVEAIIQLGDTLDLTLVAEGVETTEQLQMLREMHCPLAQGYLMHRPQTPDVVTELLAAR